MAFFAARQPILDNEQQLYAYELLFRDSMDNVFPDISEDVATSQMLAGLQFNLGFDTLAQGKLAFINFPQKSLLERYPLLMPKEQLVVEVLETVKPNRQLLNAVVELKEKGYRIALDDYEHKPVWKHFYPYTDIIKIDYSLTSEDEIRQIIQAIQPYPHIELLAEKVETHEQYEFARDLGFKYFQGYFFSKPEVLESANLDPGQQTLAQLMVELADDDVDLEHAGKLFETDVNLTFKLLRYAQSPIFKRRAEIDSIKQALVILGLDEVRRFVGVLFAAQFKDHKPAALTLLALTRAHFCELVARQTGQPSASAFLAGMLSLMHAMLDTPLPNLLDSLPLSAELKLAIAEQKGPLGLTLNLCKLFETGHWSEIKQNCQHLNLPHDTVEELYLNAVSWAGEREQFLS
ncbi:uncharacterized protein HMF8227_01935 [Saliniradius amylolyticus]|uniref:HDOD domain-containing protein n=1 Tax=Saliniradius amylolyticus TaxID=2183582 RepID=A0A2S2E430_9ALTE|nr:HDOD domain-containing protein [Saliniradius amylolyticus]AWL12405.1 uncharacterized protein HMF8227_01935 [Saliniradius amylolyticus]